MIPDDANLVIILWLFVTFDTDGEVIFVAASTPTHRVFNGLPNMHRVYFRLRHQYHFW
jgi:hypothetical protein